MKRATYYNCPQTPFCFYNVEVYVIVFFLQVRFFMEIMWPVVLFIGLVWLRRANPLYRQHECKTLFTKLTTGRGIL